MTDKAAVLDEPATADEAVVRRAPKVQDPKPLPPHVVILHNDDFHTQQYVMELLMKVFRYEPEKAFTLMMQVHERGRAIVWSGSKEVAELKAEQVKGYGVDSYAPRPVEWPLRVTVEPAA